MSLVVLGEELILYAELLDCVWNTVEYTVFEDLCNSCRNGLYVETPLYLYLKID